MEVPENRNGVGSSPWPQFPFASSKNTKIFHRQANVASSRGRQVEPGTPPPPRLSFVSSNVSTSQS